MLTTIKASIFIVKTNNDSILLNTF